MQASNLLSAGLRVSRSAGQQIGVGRNLTDGFAVLPKKQTRICACSPISFCDFAVLRIDGDS
jgi:hypothetical protein